MSARARPWFVAVPMAALCAAIGGWYLHRMGCSALETTRVVLGLTLLWGPVGALAYALLPAEVEDRISRLALAWSASYALTTLAYFGCAVLRLTAVFYTLQAAALLAALVLFRRARRGQPTLPPGPWLGVDWGLLVLLAVVLALNVVYQEPFRTTEVNGDTCYTYQQFGDQLYHVGQAYELKRNLPPKQMMVRAGLPERAYHNFPHVTMMLIARYTRQHDLLRAHPFYHYAAIEILFALCLFGIGRTLTGARWMGYLSVLLMYGMITAGPVIKNNGIPSYYFTLFTHGSSGLEPVAGTSPQMYSGLLVFFGILLGLVWVCKNRTAGRSVWYLACVLTLMTVSTLRFRIHIFIALLPLCLLALALLWKQTRSWLPLALAAVALLLSGLLYQEMKGAQYFQASANLRIGYNHLTDPGVWLTKWPLSQQVKAAVDDFTDNPSYRQWLWQILGLSGFTLLNVIGLPLLVVTVIALRSTRARQQYGWFLATGVAMTLLSIAVGVLVTTDYDGYSVGGQMLIHTHWYLFALHPIAIWAIYRHLRDRRAWPAWGLGTAMAVVVGLVLFSRFKHPPQAWWANAPFVLSSDERLALDYLHKTAPGNAIILTNRNIEPPFFMTSGLTGRGVYLEFANCVLDNLTRLKYPQENRLARIHELWTQRDPDRFQELLRETHATLLLEYADHPLAVEGGRSGLRRIWRSPHQFVTVYSIESGTPTDRFSLRTQFTESSDLRLFLPSTGTWSGIDADSLVTMSRRSEGLVVRASGDDPMLILPAFVCDPRTTLLVRVDLTAPADTILELFYETSRAPGYSGDRKRVRDLHKGRNVVYLTLEDSVLSGRLRLDPGMLPGEYVLHSLEVRGVPRANTE